MILALLKIQIINKSILKIASLSIIIKIRKKLEFWTRVNKTVHQFHRCKRIKKKTLHCP